MVPLTISTVFLNFARCVCGTIACKLGTHAREKNKQCCAERRFCQKVVHAECATYETDDWLIKVNNQKKKKNCMTRQRCGYNDNDAGPRTVGVWQTIERHVSLGAKGIIHQTNENMTAVRRTMFEPTCNELIVYKLSTQLTICIRDVLSVMYS